jgi:murein L,D-transpeptidase YcbB/YkuD
LHPGFIQKLASWVLQGEPLDLKNGPGSESGKQYVTLRKTVPVYLVYFTAFVYQLGKLNFREDIYDRDNKLKDMIFEKNGSKSAQ